MSLKKAIVALLYYKNVVVILRLVRLERMDCDNIETCFRSALVRGNYNSLILAQSSALI